MTPATAQQSDQWTGKNLPQTAISKKLDQFIVIISKLFSWLWVATIFVIAVTILVRYGTAKFYVQTDSYLFARLISSVFWEELTWYLYGWAWLFSMSYVVVTDEHVRVDLIHEKLSKRAQVWIETLGILFLLLPLFFVIAAHGWDFAVSSFRDGEGSQQVGLDFVWAIKFAIPITLIVTLMACVSRVLKCFEYFRLRSGLRFNPILILVQMAAVLYFALFIYFMYSWSVETSMQPMIIFQLFGL